MTVARAGVQAPAPSQPPAVQVVLSRAHTACGSCPAATGAQTPSELVRLQARQPLQEEAGVSQHTPSTQLPDLHSPAPPQGVPFDFGPHCPLEQGFGALHSATEVHEV